MQVCKLILRILIKVSNKLPLQILILQVNERNFLLKSLLYNIKLKGNFLIFNINLNNFYIQFYIFSFILILTIIINIIWN